MWNRYASIISSCIRLWQAYGITIVIGYFRSFPCRAVFLCSKDGSCCLKGQHIILLHSYITARACAIEVFMTYEHVRHCMYNINADLGTFKDRRME